MMGWHAWSWWVAATLAAQDPLVETGRQFVVEFHRGRLPDMLALRMSAEALAAAESAWPVAERLLLLVPGQPIRLHVHCVEGDFRVAAAALGPAAPFVERYVDPAGPTAHVLFWPPLLAADLESVGMPTAVRANVVLAAAEALAVQKSPIAAKDRWLAGVFAYAVLEGKAAQTPKYGVDPLFDSRRWQHQEATEPKSLRHWVKDTAVPGRRDACELAEEGMCLVAQLVVGAGSDWARRWFAAPPPAADTVVEIREAAVERLLGKDWQKIEARWSRQLREVKVPLRVRSAVAQLAGKRFLLVGGPDHAATIESANAVPDGPYRMALTVELAGGDGEEDGLRVQLAWDGTTWIGVFLRRGEVVINEWRAGEWSLLGKGKAEIVAGKPCDIVLEVATDARELRVLVDRVVAVRWNFGGREMHGHWSIAKNSRPAWIEGLRVEPLGK